MCTKLIHFANYSGSANVIEIKETKNKTRELYDTDLDLSALQLKSM